MNPDCSNATNCSMKGWRREVRIRVMIFMTQF
jgi:hypothetical protein